TRFSRDWSSDVCSSDLFICGFSLGEHFLYLLCKYIGGGGIYISINALLPLVILLGSVEIFLNCYGICLSFLPNVFVHYIKNQKRSEERRVGKECIAWWS